MGVNERVKGGSECEAVGRVWLGRARQEDGSKLISFERYVRKNVPVLITAVLVNER